jgi:hypothetical protein
VSSCVWDALSHDKQLQSWIKPTEHWFSRLNYPVSGPVRRPWRSLHRSQSPGAPEWSVLPSESNASFASPTMENSGQIDALHACQLNVVERTVIIGSRHLTSIRGRHSATSTASGLIRSYATRTHLVKILLRQMRFERTWRRSRFPAGVIH